MTFNKKNIAWFIMLSGLLIPFVLITDIFPFMRFGMFAEPIKTEIQTEHFILYTVDSKGNKILFDSEKMGINPNTFHYLCRNYIYRKQSGEFLEKVIQNTAPSIKKLELYSIISKNGTLNSDTTLVGIYAR